MSITRYIAHYDLDSFYVSVERILKPELLGIPLIVGGHGSRSVVSSCSYEARKMGVRSAMPVSRAKQLCPQAVVVSPDMKIYSHYSGIVTDIIESNVPLMEKASIDEFYVDLSGMDAFFDPYAHATMIREKVIQETGLPISFGFGSSKTIAKIATGLAKPNGQLRVQHGSEKEFLAPLSVAKIPMAGEKSQQILMKMGIHTIGQLQKASPGQLEQELGKLGLVLWNKANGIDHSEVSTDHDRKSISTERTFEEDTLDRNYLQSLLMAMGEELGYKIRKEGIYSACVALKLRYNNFETVSKQLTISATQSDKEIQNKAIELFNQLYKNNQPIRLIGVRLSNLGTEKGQAGLFDTPEQDDRLYSAIDAIKDKFGKLSVKSAASLRSKK